MSKHAHGQSSKQPGYETRDANVGLIVLSGVILAIVVVFSFLYMVWLFKHDVGHINRSRPVPTPLTELDPVPPEPRLRVDAAIDMAALRAYENSFLEGYEWTDASRRTARVPIERAIAIVAEQGLPTYAPPPAEEAP